MAKPANHECRWRIVSHTTAKPVRVLLGCACSATKLLTKDTDPRVLEHLCCTDQVLQDAA